MEYITGERGIPQKFLKKTLKTFFLSTFVLRCIIILLLNFPTKVHLSNSLIIIII